MLGIRPTCRTRTWKGCHARQICLLPSELYLTATFSHQISTTLGVVRSAVTARHHESSGCSSCRFKSLLQQDSRVQQLHHQPRKKLLLVACPKSKMKEAGSEKMSAAHCGRLLPAAHRQTGQTAARPGTAKTALGPQRRCWPGSAQASTSSAAVWLHAAWADSHCKVLDLLPAASRQRRIDTRHLLY